MCHRLSHSAAALPGLLLLAAALAACGSSASSNDISTRTAAEILSATKLAAEGASAVHVSGSIDNGGRPVGLDVNILAGRGARGRLSENGLSFELIQAGGSVYIKGSPAFYRHVGGASAAQLLHDRWLKAPASSPEFASLSSLTDLRRLVDTALSTQGGVAKSGTATVNGQRALALANPSRGGTLFVATTGRPFPIEITKTGANGGSISFDRWDQPVALTIPADALDITQLQAAH
jgi:hypothetical protein